MMGATNSFAKVLPLLLLLCYFCANSMAANESGSTDANSEPNPEPNGGNDSSNPEPSESRPSRIDELWGDLRSGTISSRYGRTHEIEEDEADVILTDRLQTIRSKQCSACIDGCRMYTVEGSEILEDLIEYESPQSLREIMGMKPVIDSIIARYSHLEGKAMPVHHAVRECTVVHRAYLVTFIENQIRSVEPGSSEDIFYGFSERLSPSVRLQTLQDHIEYMGTPEYLELTTCEAEDVRYTAFFDDELPNFDDYPDK